MNSLKQPFNARYFPTITKPLVTGLVASAVVVALRAFGITDVVPEEVNSAVAPLIGFLAAAVAQKTPSSTAVATTSVTVTPAIHTSYKPGGSLGQTIAQTFLGDVAKVIDSDPALIQSLGAQALERVLHPAVAVPVAADLVKLAEDAVQAPQGPIVQTSSAAPTRPTEVVATGNN